jgi:hypothetical protein
MQRASRAWNRPAASSTAAVGVMGTGISRRAEIGEPPLVLAAVGGATRPPRPAQRDFAAEKGRGLSKQQASDHQLLVTAVVLASDDRAFDCEPS